ncbi:purine-cytosine permease family protein [Mycobacterium saskatchewanense]|uniref:Cytosine permease n=1 Tax=Mycobacterium saskatchewanense TaxID=220927 RepID=A0AAJ3NMR5_9MYCO|nr:cytosine permease [Mycobacterium saskatchewanense]ORW69052.1 hypothetical protein AWC23_20080 [Mycobacterium saskatchewanense]
MKTLEVEHRTTARVPQDERFGRARDLLGIWFAFNMGPLGLVEGAVGVTLGLSTVWVIVGLLLGNMLGGLTMAFHAAQGPALGVPQMLQARGQFGMRGASVLTSVQVVVALGYFVSVLIASAQSVNRLFPAISVTTAIFVSIAMSFLITFVGFRLISAMAKVVAGAIGIFAVILIMAMVMNGSLDSTMLRGGDFKVQSFFLVVSVAASWQLAWAPDVSDYSRYLPSTTGSRPAFWCTYLGCSLGGALMMILGALAAATVSSADALEGLHTGVGALGAVALVLCVAAAATMNTVNSYSATICVVSTYEGFRPVKPLKNSRFVALGAIYVLALVLALAGSSNFTTHLITFVYMCMYVLIPWSAINLADYYIVRHGHYDVQQFFMPHAGIYGDWNKRAGVVFLIGLAVEVPFMATELYQGPIAHMLGGIDVAWVVGYVVSFGLYVAIAQRSKSVTETVRSLDPTLAVE